jgi:hypothetical protein
MLLPDSTSRKSTLESMVITFSETSFGDITSARFISLCVPEQKKPYDGFFLKDHLRVFQSLKIMLRDVDILCFHFSPRKLLPNPKSPCPMKLAWLRRKYNNSY